MKDLVVTNIDAFKQLGGMTVMTELKALEVAGKLDKICRGTLVVAAIKGVAKTTAENLGAVAIDKLLDMSLELVTDTVWKLVLKHVSGVVNKKFSVEKIKFKELKGIKSRMTKM